MKKKYINQIAAFFEWSTKDVISANTELKKVNSVFTTKQIEEILLLSVDATNSSQREHNFAYYCYQEIADDFINKFCSLFYYEPVFSVVTKFNLYEISKMPQIEKGIDEIIKYNEKFEKRLGFNESYEIEEPLYSYYNEGEILYDKHGIRIGTKLNKFEAIIRQASDSYMADKKIYKNRILNSIFNLKNHQMIRELPEGVRDDLSPIMNEFVFKIIERVGSKIRVIDRVDTWIDSSTSFNEKYRKMIIKVYSENKTQRKYLLIYFATEMLKELKNTKTDLALDILDDYLKTSKNSLRPRYYEIRKIYKGISKKEKRELINK